MKLCSVFNVMALSSMVLAGCSSSVQSTPEKLTLAAAASMETVLEETILPAFEEEYNVEVEGVYDASGKLVTQIENGLQADVFISAGKKQMNTLVDEGYVSQEDVTDLLENQLVLIVPADEDTITSWQDLASAQTVAIGDPDSVPAGQYAKEALENLGLYETVLSKASLGSNVTEVLSWVIAGNAQAGIVYATDAAQSDGVKVVAAVPEGALETQVIYPAAILKDAPDKETAQKFMEFLKTDTARTALEQAGFTVLD